MVGDEARVDLVALDLVEIEGFQQAFAGRAQGKVGFDIDHVPLHVAALDHGLELAVVGRAVLDDFDVGGFGEGNGPRFFLGVLGGTAPADEVQAVGGLGGLTCQGQQAGGQHCGYTFAQQHGYALVAFVIRGGAFWCARQQYSGSS
ncbi:hypothetical protein D3C77_591920 [compost metagenome]